LRLVHARYLRSAGTSAEAMSELETAVRSLDGVEQIDALYFATVVADDMQSPQRAETYAALGEHQAWAAALPAKAGALLTLRGRVLSRIGFPREADRVLERGLELLDSHADAGQRFRGRLNRAWVQLDRGQAAGAEAGFARLREEAKELEGPISLADKEAYWARAAFAVGRPTEALAAVERAEAAAKSLGVPAPAFIAAIARAEGALYFERYEEALAAADLVMDFVTSQFHDWENRARVLRARALVGMDRLEEATAEAGAALNATPEGVNGLRLRKEIEVARLLALPQDRPWPQREVENLTDELLAANWNLAALDLMIARAKRERDTELALYAAGLANDLGIPTLAVRAAHLAKMWTEPAGQAIAFSAQGVVRHLPESWFAEWTGREHVAAALAVEVADDHLAAEALTAQWAAVVAGSGLGAYEVLSPAQRRAQGLVRRTKVKNTGRRILQAAAVLLLAGAVSVGVTVFLSNNDEPQVIIQTLATTTTLPTLEETQIPLPDGVDFFSGVASYRGDPGRSGVAEGTGVAEATGYYWKYPTAGPIVASPVTFGKWVFIASTDSTVQAVDMTTGRQLWSTRAEDAIYASPVVAQVDDPSGNAQAPSRQVIAYGSDDGFISFRDALLPGGQVFWRYFTGNGMRVRGAPLIVGDHAFVVTSGPSSGQVLSLAITAKEVAWTFVPPEGETLGPVIGAPAYDNGILYFGTRGVDGLPGHLFLVDAETGELICMSPPIGDIEVNPVVVDGVVYVPTAQGEIHARVAGSCTAVPDNRIFSYSATPQVNAAPAVIGDTLVVPIETNMLAIDLPTNELNWIFDSGALIRSAPVVSNGIVYFGNDTGLVFALDLATGDELWRWQTGNRVESSVAVLDGVVFVTSTDGTLYAIGGPAGAAG
jgi:outer membrane protein assembly factor BamB/tetratricopeptide (TPR) repeat protein